MGLDEPDEIGEFAARGGRLPGLQRREHILELVVQAGLQRRREVEAVDRRHQIVDLGGCALDRHGEARTDRAIRIVTIAGRAGDGGGADGEGRAGGRCAAHGGRRAIPIFIYCRWRRVGDDGPMRAGGIDRDGGGQPTQTQIVIDVSGLVGPDVAGGLTIIGTGRTALVGRQTLRRRDVVDGRAAGKQGNSLSRAAVILQAALIELGVGVLQVTAGRKATVGGALQVVALIAIPANVVAPMVVGHDAPANAHRAPEAVEATAGTG